MEGMQANSYLGCVLYLDTQTGCLENDIYNQIISRVIRLDTIFSRSDKRTHTINSDGFLVRRIDVISRKGTTSRKYESFRYNRSGFRTPPDACPPSTSPHSSIPSRTSFTSLKLSIASSISDTAYSLLCMPLPNRTIFKFCRASSSISITSSD